MYKEAFQRLPDNYSGEGQLNNENLYKITYKQFNELETVFEDIKVSRDIDSAIGKSLDLLGKNVSELRSTNDDELFREFIKTKIIANLSQGDIETINKVADFLLKDKYIGTVETWNNDIYNDLAGLVIKMYPNYRYIPTVLNRVKAGGIKLFFETEMEPDILGLFTSQRDIGTEFPITNEFRAASKEVKILKEPIYMNTKVNTDSFEYQLCNEFSPQGKGDITTGTINIESDTSLNDVIYPLCGEFLLGEVI